MFLELAKGIISDNTVKSVRRKYGLMDSNEYMNCETRNLEEKSDVHTTPADHNEEIVTATKVAPTVMRVRRSRRVKEEEPLLESGKIT